MRWRQEGEDGQSALFDADERHVGRGEFRGLTFHHVRAKRLVNSLPASTRLPFRHTVNAYRGCSHACSFCFARPTHDYLGLDVDEGFERDIVVKVNAVERLRAELDPKRWCGEPIAMGTNTDPYQRCEGKYHLTQGLIEVLAAARNPFSILTKSTLLLRDADLLAEAQERTDVSLLFSVGTLEDDVWRATEPGTPPPRKRLEAIARLRDRGIPCGVLVAPVLPGLSDSPEQIKAVVAAAREAGAATIGGGMLLYLTELVRPVFLRRLAESHPQLLERYEALYQRTRPPKAEQQRVSAVLAEALEGFRPTAVRVTSRRPATAPSPPEERAQQLALGV